MVRWTLGRLGRGAAENLGAAEIQRGSGRRLARMVNEHRRIGGRRVHIHVDGRDGG
jgi:hypothetical protein